jgi:Cdc6-like AAA superfamily ATPase
MADSDDEIDVADPIRASIRPTDAARIATMERVRAKYIRCDRDAALEEGVNFLIERLVTRKDPEAAPTDANRREGRSLVVLGESGAGKTTAINRVLRRHPAFPGYGVKGSGCLLVTVTVRGPCSLKQLGRQLLAALGYPLVADRSKDIVWEMVRARIEKLGVLVIHFDEIQNVTTTATVDEAIKIRNTLKSLMNDTDHPVCLIMTGLPEFRPFIGKDFQNVRRSCFIGFEPLSGNDFETLRRTVKGLANVADLSVDPGEADDIVPRLVHASMAQMGIAIEMTHDAIDNALRRDAKTLTIDDFADMFARRTGNTSVANPFIVNDWQGINCGKMLLKDTEPETVDETAPAPKRGRRRRIADA